MILVSGPTGHVGAPLLDALAGQDDPVRALVRRPEAVERVRAAGAEPVSGDLDDPDVHGGETYTLTGAAAISRSDNAKVIGEVSGKPVQVVQVSRDDARGAMLGVGIPDYTVDGLVELFDIYEKGYASAVSPDVERVLGRAPRTFEDFVSENRAAFSGG